MPRRKDPGTLRERYREVVRTEILDATEQLIEDHGVEAFTMTRVAQVVECSIGTLYRHYPSKDALLDAHRARQYDALHERFEEFNRRGRGDDAGLSKVLDAGAFWTDVFATNSNVKAMVEAALREGWTSEATGSDAPMSAATTRLLEPIADAFEAAEEQGELGKGDPTRRAERLLALVVASTPTRGPGETEGGEVGPYIVDGLLLAYGADPRQLPALSRHAADRRRRRSAGEATES